MLFTRFFLALIAWLRLQGIHIHVYLDDLLLVGRSPLHVQLSLRFTIAMLTHAGFLINLKKSDLLPVQDLVYIGGRFCTAISRVFLPEDRRLALQCVVRSFMRVGRYSPARRWLQLLGFLAATFSSVAWAHLCMHLVQWYVKQK